MMKIENIPGYFIWLKSLKTNKIFPHLIFSADVDYVTNGMVSLTSECKNEIVMTHLMPDEFISENESDLAQRINSELNRNDLKEINFIRRESVTSKKKFFESYKTYWKRLKPDQMYYQDISDSSCESIQVKKESISEFIKNGGKIILHNY
jgi:hypothetical protein